jgi:hypothetical protein
VAGERRSAEPREGADRKRDQKFHRSRSQTVEIPAGNVAEKMKGKKEEAVVEPGLN